MPLESNSLGRGPARERNEVGRGDLANGAGMPAGLAAKRARAGAGAVEPPVPGDPPAGELVAILPGTVAPAFQRALFCQQLAAILSMLARKQRLAYIDSGARRIGRCRNQTQRSESCGAVQMGCSAHAAIPLRR